jgi:hypothetical protein
MNPINWKSISAPSIDINSKSENKVDENNKGFNTYRKDPKVESNSSTSKLNNQSVLIKQASAHVTQNSGSNINHIKNSTPPMRLDQNTSGTSETGKANQPEFIKQASSNMTSNSVDRANSKEKSIEEKALEKKISASLETIKSAIYLNNNKSNSTKIVSSKFEILARNMLNKSTAPQSKTTLENFKSDLKIIKKYLGPKIYSQIRKTLDDQLEKALEHQFRV